MTLIQALILGLLQGLTEFLPVSSSGHLVIVQHFFGLLTPPVVFDVFLHLATALAVIVVLWRQLFSLDKKTLGFILFASLPAGMVGILLNSSIEALFSSVKLVALALLITGLLLFFTRYFFSQANRTRLTWQNTLLIGLFQALAIIPGISRSGSTISAGIFAKLKPELVFNFSFLLALPAIFGAALLQLKDLNFSSSPLGLPLVTGFIAAFISGLFVLKLLKKFLSQGKFSWFAYYCLALGLALLVFTS
ncbi:MAG: Undecaprenyl-diphosphatase [Candidatus Beckwithbacteria bacterium GW2011_GWA2_43_10]|uniref:Undecaprenyl-diphosphatase n=1 Tax=Candidatus Beckwithbacteria bacterium GW2011_GWA2_43_10 TaxID=1618369 RepID=A0A0G1C4R9_9BACT|nr:MAG: Undecaprenyl-diphosphatase [Candidatus Beckwithbacteria bacterium GW2011_GWA2_43_10]